MANTLPQALRFRGPTLLARIKLVWRGFGLADKTVAINQVGVAPGH
jgi:hypothetical protein